MLMCIQKKTCTVALSFAQTLFASNMHIYSFHRHFFPNEHMFLRSLSTSVCIQPLALSAGSRPVPKRWLWICHSNRTLNPETYKDGRPVMPAGAVMDTHNAPVSLECFCNWRIRSFFWLNKRTGWAVENPKAFFIIVLDSRSECRRHSTNTPQNEPVLII